jgi:hypothetical protein
MLRLLAFFTILGLVSCKHSEKQTTQFVQSNPEKDLRIHPSDTINANKITSYLMVPPFIRSELDKFSNGKFVIANPGERWSSGCIRDADVPHRQFIAGYLKDNVFTMVYVNGGIALMNHVIKMELDGQKVTAHSFDNIPGQIVLD